MKKKTSTYAKRSAQTLDRIECFDFPYPKLSLLKNTVALVLSLLGLILFFFEYVALQESLAQTSSQSFESDTFYDRVIMWAFVILSLSVISSLFYLKRNLSRISVEDDFLIFHPLWGKEKIILLREGLTVTYDRFFHRIILRSKVSSIGFSIFGHVRDFARLESLLQRWVRR